MTERPAGRDSDATLANPRAERVKRVAALAGRSARSRAGLFLVEGPQAVREAVRFAPARVRDVYFTPDAAARYREIVTSAEEAGIYLHFGTDEVLRAMSADCQGVLAVVESLGVDADPADSGATPGAADPGTADPGAALTAALGESPRLVAILSEARDPGNVGTIIRVASAAGADAVILAGDSVDVENPKVVRASVGAVFHVPVVRGVSLEDAVAAARAAGMTVRATDGTGTTELAATGARVAPADNARASAGLTGTAAAPAKTAATPTAWIFGNEARGLTPDELALADDVVRIPMVGPTESLNLASAVTLCLYSGLL